MHSADEAKKNFFDRALVQSAVDAAALRAMARFGAYVRTAARRSIRPRKAVSQAGQPPTSRLGLLRDLILFGYDASSESTVVGPARLNGRGDGSAPGLLERGGTRRARAGRAVYFTNDPGRDANGKFVSDGKRRVVLDGTLKYRPRPYMAPALERERPRFAGLFRDSLQ